MSNNSIIDKNSSNPYVHIFFKIINHMDITKYDIYQGPNIGIYTKTNDKFVFVPNGLVKSKSEKLSSYLQNDYITTSIAETRLLGILMVLNNHGVLLPNTCSKHEVDLIKKSTDMNVEILGSKDNALGNLICVNDKGGIVSPLVSQDDVKKIQDVLDIEVIQKRIAGFNQVGAVMVANSNGGIIHPQTDERTLDAVSNVMGVKIEHATINGGVPYLASGILANNKAVVVGSLTSGPEIMMLTRAFMN